MMATLKDNLRNFAKASARFSAPSTSRVSFTPVVDVDSNNTWGNETAPDVGYFAVEFGNANIGYFDLRNNTAGFSICAATLSQNTGAGFVPCNKGDHISYHLGATNSNKPIPSAVKVSFVKIVGSQ